MPSRSPLSFPTMQLPGTLLLIFLDRGCHRGKAENKEVIKGGWEVGRRKQGKERDLGDF